MRYIAPARALVDTSVFQRAPLNEWCDFSDWLSAHGWPTIDKLNERWSSRASERFVTQTRELLADGLHYEERIATQGLIATRDANWHDLFNAMVWLRYPSLKRALNRRQVADIVHFGPRERSRAQYALTHFDEAGVIVVVRDSSLLACWDSHDWHRLFWQNRAAWTDGRMSVQVFGHALLEHALTPEKLLVGKALVVMAPNETNDFDAAALCADAIRRAHVLCDPLELRPLPLSGIPGWNKDNEDEAFHHHAACYQPLRSGRTYPRPLHA